MNLDTAFLTDRGGRARNEDSWGWESCSGLTAWVVADGLGGERGGEEASRLAVSRFLQAFRDHPSLSSAALSESVLQADRAIHERQAAEPALARMGSTIVAAVCDGRRLRSIHVGDSRFYWFREKRVFFQSKDQSVPQALCDAGILRPEEIRSHPRRNILLSCLGSPEPPNPIVSQEGEIEPGDALLLCSDGFWGPLPEEEMERELGRSATASDWLHRMEVLRQERARALLDDDNYTAIGVLAGPEPSGK
ncbi:PP2C family serine/threonine-protein phosphatase [Methylacidimicrobium sp. B4]|uniref:PP2C family protein-serine/threonine phosphatase n=1 Tax=Methylacidimicrobium sp. B4 TaxID=2796139 RepID=UPI001A8D87F7|nr:PP2C family serine/threonine-protein phosphatase [Methylacidimicrobium sp. B4]QSR84647.1 serine/threonine-protein phosphatase [Methylacidimicrobium sp. B4]